MKLATLPGVNPKTQSVDAFRTVWNLINDPDVYGDQSGNDIGMRSAWKELYEELFLHYLKTGDYDNWWNKLRTRTDISDDMRWEFENENEWCSRMLNLYDNLHTQGLI